MKNLLAIISVLALMTSCAEKVVKPVAEKKSAAETVSKLENYDREKAKNLYETACYKCHDLYKPKDYTDEQWMPIMKSMAPKANLSAEESALILHYLTTEN